MSPIIWFLVIISIASLIVLIYVAKPEKKNTRKHKDMSSKNSVEKASVELANSVFQVIKNIQKNGCGEIICKNHLTRSDAAVYACFLTCFWLEEESCRSDKFKVITELFRAEILKKISIELGSFETAIAMLQNRIDFFERVANSKDTAREKITEVTEEFELIIATDLVRKEYVSYSEESPLCVIGLNTMCEAHIEITAFRKAIAEDIRPRIRKLLYIS